MEPDDGLDDGFEDEGRYFAWLPPDDRLWRHPSEVGSRDTGREIPATGGPHGDSPSTRLAARRSAPHLLTVALVAGIIGALAGSGLGWMSGAFDQRTIVRSVVDTTPSVSLASDSAVSHDWASIDDRVAPSVVAVNVSSASGPVIGSGVMLMAISGETYLLTAASVVAGGGSIDVELAAGTHYRASVVGTDPTTGLALLAIADPNPSLPDFGSVSSLRVASSVMAVGARTTEGGTVFPGLVSAEARQVEVSNGVSMPDLIAVSSPSIPSATAGGPLVDDGGQVVGVMLDIDPVDAADQNFAYAVPIDVAESVADQMLARKTVIHPWLGVTDVVDVPTAISQSLRISGGAQVKAVSPDSPASQLGLQPSDIIISINGSPVTSAGQLTQILDRVTPNQPVRISFLRGARPYSGVVRIAAQPGGN